MRHVTLLLLATMLALPAAADRPTARERLARIHVERCLLGSSLRGVVDLLRARSNANLVIDQRAFAGKDPQTSGLLISASGTRTLEILAADLGLSILYHRDYVWITRKLRPRSVTRVYDVRDLILVHRDYPGPALGMQSYSPAQSGEQALWGYLGPPLMELIRDSIARETWEGPNTIKQRNGRLFITNTPAVHQRIRALLRTLRRHD